MKSDDCRGSHYIDGAWWGSGENGFRSFNPCTGEPVWVGEAAGAETVARAVAAARSAFSSWSALSRDERGTYLQRFSELLRSRGDDLAETISIEVGKPLWESRTEVAAMAGKVAISIDALDARTPPETMRAGAVTRYRPHGVLAVLGPFNFPGHLPNGHIVPALLAGNTLVFKPSELAPWVAERTLELWDEAGLPHGVLNLVQGQRDTAVALSEQDGIDGLFFTGSSRVGVEINRAFALHPGKILSLEMGGNNPLVVHRPSSIEAAAIVTAQSAFATAGQRCTCARRLIVTAFAEREAFLRALVDVTAKLRVGHPDASPAPFMGPVIDEAAAHRCLSSEQSLIARGGIALVPMHHVQEGTGLVRPGVVDVTAVVERPDEEVFGPLLQVVQVDTLDEAIAESNRTRYGLAAGILSADPEAYEAFRANARAGIVNWNKPLTGASSSAPFGGVGLSGNHRPSAYFAADYCSYPVASLESSDLALPETLPPGLLP
ncbi:MAG: succinylglutamate-semialdehyde dehydrogenase [Myxococcota bacterium]